MTETSQVDLNQLKVLEDPIWFNPAVIQKIIDKPTEHRDMNDHIKFKHDIEFAGLRIAEIVPLTQDPKFPPGLGTIMGL